MTSEAKAVIGITIISILAVVGGALFLSKATKSRPVNAELVLGAANWQKGNKDASITVVEFSDFACPACRTSKAEVEQLLDKYGSDIKFVYRHFPLTTIHRNAFSAGVAAEVAGANVKFWEMHDLLFERQEEWSEARNVDELFVKYAEELGLERETFLEVYGSDSYKQIVQDDLRDGRLLGISATPTFYVNETQVATTDLQSAVEQILAEK